MTNTRPLVALIGVLVLVLSPNAYPNDIEKVGKKVGKAIKKAAKDVEHVFHEAEDWFQEVDCKIAKCKILTSGKKVVRETVKAPGAVVKYFKESYDELQEDLAKSEGVCTDSEKYEIVVRKNIPGEVRVHINSQLPLLITSQGKQNLHSCTEKATITFSIQANPVNCGLSSTSPQVCWYDMHKAIHKSPTGFSVELSEYNEITVFFDPNSLIRRIKSN